LICVNKRNEQSFHSHVDKRETRAVDNMHDDCVRLSPLFTSMHISKKEKSTKFKLPITVTVKE